MSILPWLLLAFQVAQPAAGSQKPLDCTAPQYRQFDFWIGQWDVRPNPDTMPKAAAVTGRRPAVSVIERAHNGCVIVENWDDQYGGTGQSLNIFDRVSQRWRQTWVGDNGGLNQYWGEFKDGNMAFVGQAALGPAARVQGRRTIRLTFILQGPDTVRQLSEALNSDGTWGINYDFIYTRRAKSK